MKTLHREAATMTTLRAVVVANIVYILQSSVKEAIENGLEGIRNDPVGYAVGASIAILVIIVFSALAWRLDRREHARADAIDERLFGPRQEQ